jgi:hypothetical protein
MKKFLFTLLVSFFIGSAIGYLGAWVDHQDEIMTYGLAGPGISHTEHDIYWLEWLTAPLSLPGGLVAIARHSQDWVTDEGWDYRWDITIGNGLGYVALCCAFFGCRALVRVIRRRLKLKVSHAR